MADARRLREAERRERAFAVAAAEAAKENGDDSAGTWIAELARCARPALERMQSRMLAAGEPAFRPRWEVAA